MFEFLKRKETFEPTIYYGKLPKRFEGKVEYIKAVRASLEGGGGVYEINNSGVTKEELDYYGERVFEENKPFLEKKVIKLMRKSEGDLILLEEPDLRITSWKIFKNPKYGKDNNLLGLMIFMSANGVLFKTNGIETCFEED